MPGKEEVDPVNSEVWDLNPQASTEASAQFILSVFSFGTRILEPLMEIPVRLTQETYFYDWIRDKQHHLLTCASSNNFYYLSENEI